MSNTNTRESAADFKARTGRRRSVNKTFTARALKGEMTRRSRPKGERGVQRSYALRKLTAPQMKALISGEVESVRLEATNTITTVTLAK